MSPKGRRLIALGGALLAAAAIVGTLASSDVVAPASADGPPSGVRLEQLFKHVSLTQPVWMEQAPGSERWFVIEQPGRVVTFPNRPDTRSRQVALDISKRVRDGGERGLLGLAFHPKYVDNGWVFLSYTTMVDGELTSRISRFQRKSATTFDEASEKVILEVEQPYSNHNGGQISFGPDGMLYIALGDGGSAGDPQGHGQDVRTLLGAMLRVDVDTGDPYAIPADNPFAQGPGAPEIYAWGLRNPWRFSFDPKTQKLWAGDVGQNAWEEIDVVERGKNYGWNKVEGRHCYPADVEDCASPKYEPPVIEYSQRDGDRSVTGGYVYRGSKWPSRVGHYIYGDFVSGRIWAFDPATKKSRLLVDTDLLISSFAQARDGEIGVVDYNGRIFHLAGE